MPLATQTTENKLSLESLNDKLQNLQADFTIPMIQRKYSFEGRPCYVYPRQIFDNLQKENSIYLYTRTVSERRKRLKWLIDLYSDEKINLTVFHFSLFCLDSGYRYREDNTEQVLGKRRYEVLQGVPEYVLKTNDEFFIAAWYSLIDRLPNRDWYYYPQFGQLRMLFHTELFESYVGTSYECDWVEPMPGKEEKHVHRWTSEKDPMAPVAKRTDMIEGEIWLASETGGLRHYVEDKPIHAGSYIEVKFGDGWIAGRYEWCFERGQPISVHSARSEALFIREGHIVRVKR
ncbi:hypothetical protein [Brevibacillus sp. SYSU BS000544]|uniref:hypothetical protein n=1 Tax=Brevibacillus sp. SYSU BS000544 TaxID=3416443 RepID=UPI003CE5281A